MINLLIFPISTEELASVLDSKLVLTEASSALVVARVLKALMSSNKEVLFKTLSTATESFVTTFPNIADV